MTNKLKELEANKEEIVLEQVIENIPYYVFWKDTESRYLGGNNLFAKSAGYPSIEEMIGKNDFDGCWTKEEAEFFRKVDKEVMQKNAPILNIEETQKQLNGTSKTLLTSKVPLHDQDNKVIGILGIYTDISERKSLEEEMCRTLKELKETQQQMIQSEKMRSLGEMAGGIAHEINNPLTIISAHTSSIKKKLAKDEFELDTILASLDKIDQTVLRISKIVKSLKSISRESDDLAMERFSIQDLIEDFTSICSERLKVLGIKLNIIFKITEDIKLLCNPVSLSQVLLNLVNNSTDALEHNSEKWIQLIISKENSKLVFKVVDSGLGISDSYIENIFQPFFTTKEVGKGTGLGLSLSRSLMLKQNATLEYDCSAKNTTFIIEYPLTVK